MRQLKITQSVTVRTMTVEDYLRDINNLPLISPEEETELAAKIKEGDEEAFRRLVEANLRFVVSVSKVYQNRGLDLCDLINEGNIGLMKAARRFDPTRGFKFISYAVWWIRQCITEAISEQGRMVRLPLNQVGVINRITREKERFLRENEREPSNEELAEFLNVTPDKISDALRCSPMHLSFDTPIGEDGDGTMLDTITDVDSPAADQRTDAESLHDDLMTVMQVLTPREREILSLSFGIGCSEMTTEEIGEKLELTRERVRQVRQKALRKLSGKSVRERLAQHL